MLSSIPFNERENFISLFQSHRHMRSTLNRILKYGMGDLFVSEKAAFAIASLDSCTYLTGSTANLKIISSALTKLKNPYRFLFSDDLWKEVLLNHYRDKVTVQVREAFSSAPLNIEKLQKLSQQVPLGFHLLPIHKSLTAQCDPQFFPIPKSSLGSFGYGFAVLKGVRVVSVATPADICDDLVEVQVNAHPEFRRQGLATVAAATFLIHCLKNGYTPDWDAKDEISASLAKKLGFRSQGKYKVINLATR